MPIRNNLKVLMAKNGIDSIKELQRQKHMKQFHYATIRHFSIGLHQRIDSDLIEAICKQLNCDIQDLLYIEKKQA